MDDKDKLIEEGFNAALIEKYDRFFQREKDGSKERDIDRHIERLGLLNRRIFQY